MIFLTPEEFALLRTSFSPRWWSFLDFLVASGCRFSEATALMPGDVDRTKDTVRVSRAWKRVPGSEESKYEIGQPKTRRSVRTVNVPASVLDQLDYSKEFLFLNSDGGPIRIYSWRTNVWVPSLAKARSKDAKNPDKVVLQKPLPYPRPPPYLRILAAGRWRALDHRVGPPRARRHLGDRQDLRASGPDCRAGRSRRDG